MKHLKIIFELLFFPFLFLLRYASNWAREEGLQDKYKKGYRLIPFASFINTLFQIKYQDRKKYNIAQINKTIFFFLGLIIVSLPVSAANSCSNTINYNFSNSSYTYSDTKTLSGYWDDYDASYQNYYFAVPSDGTITISLTGSGVAFRHKMSGCPDYNDGSTSTSFQVSSGDDFNLRVDNFYQRTAQTYTLLITFTPSCINSSSPFTSLSDASSVTTAGQYCFNLSGTTFNTYVDSNGYTLAAIDFGDGTGTLPATAALTNAARGILNTTILGKLTDTTKIRISSSDAQIDVTTTNSTLITRVTLNQTLKIGVSDNLINKDWVGTNAARITEDASCTSSYGNALNGNIIHQCGNISGFHWIPNNNNQRISWNDDEVSSSVSFRLWVKVDSYTGPTIGIISDQTVKSNDSLNSILPQVSGGTTPYTYSATGLPDGITINTTTGEISGTPTDSAGTGDFSVIVSVSDAHTPIGTVSSQPFTIRVTPLARDDGTYSVNSDTQLSGNVVDNDVVSLLNVTVLASTQHGVLTLHSDGSFDYTSNVGYVGPDTFTYTLRGDYGQDTATVTIDVTSSTIIAVDDNYNAQPGATLTGNLLSNDIGVGLTYVSNSAPTLGGTLSIDTNGNFTYTAIAAGTETFTYIITNASGATSEANVTINIGTNYVTGVQPFALVNPPETRNIIGGYKLAGNTVMCLTEKTSGYGGTCHGQTDYKSETSNRKVSKYIDIDGTTGEGAKTWNSTSSYIELPSNYDQRGGKGIMWAGLFWQGRVSNRTTYQMHYGLENGNSYTLVETGNGANYGNVNLAATEANKIKLKIDTADYEDVTAATLYNIGDNSAKTYAAFADVTSILQNANLAQGKHTFTVANLTTNEGRESSPGVFGGWSLVVIYLEDVLNGSPQNISIYSGFDSVGQNNAPIPITGFRLPSGGTTVTANLSLFSGEGEYRYGRTPTNNARDTIQLSNQLASNYSNMPGASSPLNVFDGVLDGVLRDDVSGYSNNLQTNNDGVDVDNFDVSNLMTGYRNADPLVQTVYIKYFSDNDYITPSMIAFTTELYQPKICYDYTLDINGFVLKSVNNEINTPFGQRGSDKLTTRVSIRSDEGDFPLNDVNITYRIANTSQLHYITDSTAIAPNGIYSYIPAGTTGLNQTYKQNNSGFGIYIGTGAGTVPDGPGGVIDSFETRYFKLQDEMITPSIDTRFDLWMEYTVNYGSGPLALVKNFDETALCDATGGYFPTYGTFNVTSDQADVQTGIPYNLYTQVASRNFNARIFSYDTDFTTPIEVNTSIEIEVFNAGHFNRDTDVSCFNPDSNITQPTFVRFENETSVLVQNLNYTGSIRNAGFRVWYLAAPDGSIVEHTCSSRTNETCFRAVYADRYSGTDTFCAAQCSSGTGCYACLRKYYGQPVCSRDNFAVRPEAFVTQLIDSDQNANRLTGSTLPIAHSKNPSNIGLLNEANLSAGYNYRFDINATNYLNDFSTRGYHQQFNQSNGDSSAFMIWSPGSHDVTKCNDESNQSIGVTLYNGNSINFFSNNAIIDNVAQVGNYAFTLTDENWTSADWHPDYLAHHANSGFDNNNIDCIRNNASVLNVNTSGRNGCEISSVHTKPNGGAQYTALNLRFFPHSFNITGLSAGAGPDNNKNFVYINTLANNLYPNQLDENMSYNIQGTFRAAGYNGEMLSNFVEQCYADDVNMSLFHTFLSAVPATTPNLTYDLVDFNTTNTSTIVKAKAQATFTNVSIQNVKSSVDILQRSTDFEQSMKGAISMDLGYNYARTYNTPLNPRHINFSDFNISYSGLPNINVDLKNNHKIFGNMKLDTNITFLYAKIKPGKELYDDIDAVTNIATTVTTPVSILVYCDLGYTVCQNDGIAALFAQTSDSDWWKSWDHNNLVDNDGNIELISTPISALNGKTSASIFADGEDNTITITRAAGSVLPMTIPVSLVVNVDPSTPAPAKYTDRWLIYNPINNTLPVLPLFRVNFIGSSGWAGHGETGNVVGGVSNNRKNGRVEW